MRQPPGKEIYRKGTISVYEVDGKDHKVNMRYTGYIFNKRGRSVAGQLELIFQISLVCVSD
jgi:hypothetical protein